MLRSGIHWGDVMRHSTSSETAARFLAIYRGPRRNARQARLRSVVESAPSERVTVERVFLDLAPATYAEILDCVERRVLNRDARGQEVPPVTRLALKMLREAEWRRVDEHRVSP